MRFFLAKLSILILIIISANAAQCGSPVYADAGSWNTFSINYYLNKKFIILFTEEARFRENYSRLNLFYTNIGLEYKANKYFKTSLVYRWTDKFQDDNTFSLRHRIMWDMTGKYFIKKFTLAYRHRLQVENRNVQSSESGKVPEWYSRHKFDLSYEISKKLSTYISAETRYQLHDPRNIESDQTWHRIRFQGGFDYEYTKKSKFGVYYLIQREFNVSAHENIFITGLEYSLTLNK